MKTYFPLLLFSSIIIFVATLSYCSKQTQQDKEMISKAHNIPDIISLFALTPEEITHRNIRYISEAQDILNKIITVPDNQRTYANTAQPLDDLLGISNFAIARRIYEGLELICPDENVRHAAHEAFIALEKFSADYILSNKRLYQALTAYASSSFTNENLSEQQRYFVTDTISSFEHEGLSLSDEVLAQVNALRKELAQLCADFDRNIIQDNSFITVTRDELDGLTDNFINSLKRTNDNLYILGVDYPTYFTVMENCSVAQTRKKLSLIFNNRAYPVNDDLLKTIISKRHQLAQLLGYNSFAEYDIAQQMAHTPNKAIAFLTDLTEKALVKVKAEISILTKTLPESVTLSKNGLIYPWDWAYLENNYKKSHFNIDEQKIAEYFPMQNTIDELLDIYQQFFNIDFQEVSGTGLWHEDVKIVRVLNKTNKSLLGTLLLDLFPRANKYGHAAHLSVIPSTNRPDGTRIPDVSIVIANFSKPTNTQPSLLKRSEVQTFFHEFGHALHAVLGATDSALLSGTHTKTDFVELPSQMLEEWLTEKDILKKISCHYETKQPLPDDIIETILQLKNLTSGSFVTRQAYLSMIALSYFGSDQDKDPYTIMKQLYTNMSPYIEFSPDNHFYTSFGHLMGYGAKYYGYLWSKTFALDLFGEIKKYGLLNPIIGQKYVKEVLSKGGAQDPNELLYNFLGRDPNSNAFFNAMGLLL